MADWATNIALGTVSDLYITEFEGDEISPDEFEIETNWALGGEGVDLTTSTTAKSGEASISFGKAAGATVYAWIYSSSIESHDISDGTYDRLWIYLPTLTNLTHLSVILGQSDAHRGTWTIPVANLAVGWNRLYLSIDSQGSGVGYGTTGTPDMAAVTYVRAGVIMSDAADTYAGVLVDKLTHHPPRFSTASILSPVTKTYAGFLRVPSMEPMGYDIKSGTFSTGSASFTITDPEADGHPLIEILDKFTPLGREIELKMSFRGEIENSNTTKIILRGYIDVMEHTGKSWDFVLLGPMDRFIVPFMSGASDSSVITLDPDTHIVDHVLQLATSTGHGNNGDYDVLPSGQGAGIPVDLIDIALCESTRDEWIPYDFGGGYQFDRPEDSFLSWLQEHVFLPYALVPYFTLEGKLALKNVRPNYGPVALVSVSRANIIRNVFPSFQFTRDLLINQINVYHSFNYTTEIFDGVETADSEESQRIHGIVPLTIESYMIQDSATALRCVNRILRRYGPAIPTLKLIGDHTLTDTELGELLAVSEETIPNVELQKYGVTDVVAELVVGGPNPSEGVFVLGVHVTSYHQGNYRRIGPATLPDYDSQTDEQKASYVSIAGTDDTLGTEEDPAHEIGPK